MVDFKTEKTKTVDTNFNIHDLELSQIRRFVTVVDCGTFVAAAQKLCITQQALSTSIAKMENLAGVKFLDRRRGGRVALTVFGRLLLPRARSLIAMSEQAMTEIGLLRSARGGSVTLGIGETMTGRNVAAAVRRFHQQQPDVQIRLMEGYTESMVEKLIEGEVDFVVGGPSHHPSHSAILDYRHVFVVRDVLAVRSSHPLANVKNVTLADMAGYTWMVPDFRGDVYDTINITYMRANLPPPKRIIRSDAITTGTWLFLDDDYIITVSPDMVAALISLGALTTLDNNETTLTRHACVITKRDVKLSPSANRLMEEILLEAERLPEEAAEPSDKPIKSQTKRVKNDKLTKISKISK